jgi:hypothetical protein
MERSETVIDQQVLRRCVAAGHRKPVHHHSWLELGSSDVLDSDGAAEAVGTGRSPEQDDRMRCCNGGRVDRCHPLPTVKRAPYRGSAGSSFGESSHRLGDAALSGGIGLGAGYLEHVPGFV